MSKKESLNENIDKEENRNKVIVRTSVIGIVTNVILASVKAVIGLMANSIAVVLDAVNNLSDALSSIITIVGNKLSRKLPNEKHPLGYGRIEYLTAMVIASIVIYAGITSCVESFKKIIPQHGRRKPSVLFFVKETTDFSSVVIFILFRICPRFCGTARNMPACSQAPTTLSFPRGWNRDRRSELP